MKLQITAQEIKDALKTYFRDYKGLEIYSIDLTVNEDDDLWTCDGPTSEAIYALAEFRVIP
jgi:hypothetical protein